MTMLPDIDQQAWDEYERQTVQEQIQNKIASFGLDRMIGDKIAGLQSLVGAAPPAPPPEPPPPPPEPTPLPTPEPTPLPPPEPEPLPTPEPPPPAPPTSFEPPPAPAPAPFEPAAVTPSLSPAPAPEPPPPAPVTPAPAPTSSGLGDWFGNALNAVQSAGGNVQAFASNFSSGAGDAFGSALNAAAQAGADVQQFAASLPPPPPPPAPPVAQPTTSTPEVTQAALQGGGGPVNPAPSPDEVRAYITQAAQARGIDPNIALRVANSEGGMEAARRGTFKTGSSWWPFQLHYGGKGYEHLGNVAGMGNSFTAETGYAPGDPNAWQAATDYALDRAKKSGWSAWYGAKAQGITGFAGIDRSAADIPFLHKAGEAVGGALRGAGEAVGGAARGVYDKVKSGYQDISQFGDAQLTTEEAYAACGPAAAVRFAQRLGRNPSLREALDLAKTVGWTAAQGMAGITSQQKLMQKMGIETELVSGPQWARFAQEAQTGNPVTISTSAHYFYADGYDPNTGAFHVGRSGTDLRGGKEWMTKEEIIAAAQRLGGGTVQGALLADNPNVPAPSTSGQTEQPNNYLDRLRNTIGDSFSGLGTAVQTAVGAATDEATQSLDRAIVSTQKPSGRRIAAGMVGGPMIPGDASLEEPGLLENLGRGISDTLGANAEAFGRAAERSGLTGLAEAIAPPEGGRFGVGASGAGQFFKDNSLLNQIGKQQELADKYGLLGVDESGRYRVDASAFDRMSPEDQRAWTDATMAIGGSVESVGARAGAKAAEAAVEAAAPAVSRAADQAVHGLSINLPKYMPEEVQTLIRQAYDNNPEVMDAARRGVMSDEVVKELADAAGTNVNRIVGLWKPGQAKNAETIYAMRQALADQAMEVVRAQKTLRANPDSTEALGSLIQNMTKQRALQEAVTGVTAEAGRAVRQFRQPISGQRAVIGEIDKLAARLKMEPDEVAGHLARMDLEDPHQVANMVHNLMRKDITWKDRLSSLWYFQLLSNPLTHIRNTASNTLTTLTRPVETAVAAGFDPLARAMLGETGPRQRYIQEAGAEYVGMYNHLGDGLKDAWNAIRHGYSPQRIERGEFSELERQAFKGTPLSFLEQPGRWLQGEDAFFRSLNEGATLHGGAIRRAMMEGLSGDAAAKRAAELITSPTKELLDEVAEQGAYRVFQQKSDFANRVIGVRDVGDNPIGKFIVPFVKTPINITKFMLERSPAGAAKLAYDFATPGGRAALREAGSGALADRMARAGIGTGTFAGLVKYALDGNITGAAPSDPTERDAFYRQGKQPYSFKNPITGDWNSYQALQPYAALFAAAGDTANAYQKGQLKHPGDIPTIAASAGLATGRAMLDMPWTQGMVDVMDILQGNDDPSTKIKNYLNHTLPTLVPLAGSAAMRGLSRATDRIIRDPDNPYEALLAGIPGLSGQVDPRLDAFGQPRERPIGGWESMVNPFNPSTPTTDPVELELANLTKGGFRVEPGLVSKNMTAFGQPVELTSEQEHRYQELAGTLSYAALQMFIGTEEWNAMPDADKAKAIESIYSRSREAVRTLMQPDLAGQAVESAKRRAAQRASILPTPTAETVPAGG